MLILSHVAWKAVLNFFSGSSFSISVYNVCLSKKAHDIAFISTPLLS